MSTAPVSVPTSAPTHEPSRIQWPSLTVALLIMVGGTLYPPLMADAAGQADHDLAMALFWAMSAGFVRGVGFVPRRRIWRAIFSGWACAGTLLLAVMLKLQH